MAAANLLQTVSSILSLALLTSGGASAAAWQPGQTGYTVAEVQAELGVLGFNAGPVNGRVSSAMIRAAEDYSAAFGITPNTAFDVQLNHTINAMGTVPSSAHGTLILSVEDDLKTLGVYGGTLRGTDTSLLTQAISAFQKDAGLATTGTLTAGTLVAIAHLTAVHVTAHHHWPYHAQPGDSMAALAFAGHFPYAGFLRANNQHGSTLWAGQIIHWRTAKASTPSQTTQSPQSSSPASQSPTSSTGTPVSTGVLANLAPVSDLVVMNPSARDVEALATAEGVAGVSLDVSVSGQWALTHPGLMKSLVGLNNEVAINSYSGVNLNSLPAWGVKQELTWAVRAVQTETGTAPTFVLMGAHPNSTVIKAADTLTLIAMSPNVVLPADSSVKAVDAALVSHPNQVVEVSGTMNWASLFASLKAKHFVFETLGQIWANQ